MGNELLAVYYIGFKEYSIYGCWDKETPENEFSFYDIYDKKAECLNMGDPLYEFPSREEVKEFLYETV